MSHSRSDTRRSASSASSLVIAMVADALNVAPDAIAGDASFTQLGLDSSMAVRLVQQLNRELGLSLSVARVFDHPTVRRLGEFLARELAHSQPDTTGAAKPTAGAATSGPDAIAVIGMSGRFPMARDLNELWANIAAGKDCTAEVPADRWPHAQFYDPDASVPGKTYGRWMGAIDDIESFDAGFFNISMLEAEWMDPRQRVFLQSAWSCIEDAGINPMELAGARCGVFVGCRQGDYGRSYDAEDLNPHAYLGESSSILSARISYFLDLKGPCLAIDTACSSALVAVAEACDSLILGRSDLALAGGIALLTGPIFHVMAAKTGLLSRTGHCYTFDQRADGIVPGEGVGVLLLKRLSDAVRDGDRIEGVIRAWGVNQDGKTNGITAPSVTSQADLLRQVYDRGGVDPATISMVEAHGTGTKLGDPIEVEALTTAFRRYTADAQYCALGSVKPNIGHLLAAAGIAGLIKALLALRHKQLPPTAHFAQVNDLIPLADSPFFVVNELRAWAPRGETRRAAVSAFGFSGTNAHVVIEEHIPEAEAASSDGGAIAPAIIVLSAPSARQLDAQVGQLVAALDRFSDADLGDIAYTLQRGRRVMKHRLAVVARSIAALRDKLGGFLARATVDELYQGVASEAATTRTDDELGEVADAWIAREAIGDWLQHGGDPQFLALWVAGRPLAWERLHASIARRRVSLPTYPFEPRRIVVHRTALPAPRSASEPDALVPVLRSPGTAEPTALRLDEVADAEGAHLRAVLTGREAFLADHVVNGAPTLPAVAYLELARAALERTYRSLGAGVALRNVVFLRPLAFSAATAVHVRIRASATGDAAFSISSGGDGVPEVVHCEGRVAWLEAAEPAEPALDLAALDDATPWTATQCYDAFARAGIHYGPSHRAVQGLQHGRTAAGDETVAGELRLSDALAGSLGASGLQIALLDAALQASIALRGRPGEHTAQPPVMRPFALAQIEARRAIPAQAWVAVRPSSDDRPDERTRRFDIDVRDAQARLCVRITGYTVRAAESQGDARPETLLVQRTWSSRPLAEHTGWPASRVPAVIAIVGGPALAETTRAIAAGAPGARVIALDSPASTIDAQLAGCAAELLACVQQLLRERPTPLHLQLVVRTVADEATGLLRALSGLLKTAQLEHPDLLGQTIEVAATASASDIRRSLQDAAHHRRADARYDAGRLLVPVLSEYVPGASDPGIPWKRGGVYLITGGVGGLGWLVAREAPLARTPSATVVLAGRSQPSAARAAEIEQLRSTGAAIELALVDIAQAAAVDALVRDLVVRHGALDGIVHAAGVVRDRLLSSKTRDELAAVLAPKVAGAMNLDRATQDLPLDIFVAFASTSGVFGNVGQADYALANGFLDEFCDWRQRLVDRGERRGRTVAIDWCLWLDGGMQVDAAGLARRASRGQQPLSAEQGIAAMYRACEAGLPQVLVLSGAPGARDALRALIAERAPAVAVVAAVPPVAPSGAELRDQAAALVRGVLAKTLRARPDDIELDTSFDAFGLDSILAVQLVTALERVFGPLSKTLFFEHRSVASLLDYFLASHRDRLIAVLAPPDPPPLVSPPPALPAPRPVPPAPSPVPPAAPSAPVTPPERKASPAVQMTTHEASAPRDSQDDRPLDIAIIGISGRYPKANDLRELWINLTEARDCITAIPRERWDYARDLDETRSVPGKSYSKWGGFIDGVDEFDAQFFNVSPREAQLMDPQERLFLQCVYETLEDAGYTRDTLRKYRRGDLEGSVGVFVGVMYQEYQLYAAQAQLLGQPYAVGGTQASIANRISYFCDFHGPSIAVDSMCSSSLTSLHLACHSLRRGECKVAIAGGTNLTVHPNKYVRLSQGKFVSSAGRCESFGEGGEGYVPGEGIGAVLLKPLADAIADRDQIYGVIKATALNHGGRTNGYTVPNPSAQAHVVAQAIRESGVSPRAVSYIEAHGTGTSLGDPIEIVGLTNAFRQAGSDEPFCAIGSVKSNIGHCEGAAGIAGLTKVVLQLKHRMLVPSLHSAVLNPRIDFARTPFTVQQRLAVWKRPIVTVEGQARELPRVAGLSSFGAGGANAHVIVEEYVAPAATARPAFSAQHPAVIVVSAKTDERLQERVRRLRDAIDTWDLGDDALGDLAYTLQIGREAMEHRLAFTAASLKDVRSALTKYLAGESVPGLHRNDIALGRDALTAAKADPRLAETVAGWLATRTYDRALELWTQGLAIDWTALYGDAPPRRISLPTYPFARKRHWVPELAVQVAAAAGQVADAIEAPVLAAPIVAAAPVPTIDVAAIEVELTASLSAALYIEPSEIDRDVPFVEMGLDSVVGVEWISAINKRYGLKLLATRVYDYPTIRALTSLVGGELAKQPAPVTVPAAHATAPIMHTPAVVDRAPYTAPTHEPIAIIGMSGAFPKSNNLAELWRNLAGGVDCISEVPPERWSVAELYDPDPAAPGKTYSKWLGVLDEMDRFDPLFFHISPADAARMSPQQRLFLEHCWSCIEDAGLDPRGLSGSRCGVYVGCGAIHHDADDGSPTGQKLLGNASSILAARISYFLNLLGPSIAIDTACSSALVAIAEACDSLQLGRTDLVLAGGVSVLPGPDLHIMTSKAGMLSSAGHCYAFDRRADGFVPGEGVGVVLLKRLGDAERDGDTIHGVIRGWGTNQDGKTNGITAPSVRSQTLLQKEVYERFQIDPGTISLVETHGTGTRLGDPIEVEALTESFRAFTTRRNFCALGAVKSNLGHLLAASGIAGLLKTLLALRHEQLPPAALFQELNERIRLDDSPFYINRDLRAWPRERGPRRAAISAFGFSGTNAHLVVEEHVPAVPRPRPAPVATSSLFVVSARTEPALARAARQLRDHLEQHVELDLAATAYTLQVGREAMECRLAFAAGARHDAIAKLAGFAAGRATDGVFRGQSTASHDASVDGPETASLARQVESAVQQSDLRRLAELWVGGARIDWRRLAPGVRPRVSLPTYAFARDRFGAAPTRSPSATPARDVQPARDIAVAAERVRAAVPAVTSGPSVSLRALDEPAATPVAARGPAPVRLADLAAQTPIPAPAPVRLADLAAPAPTTHAPVASVDVAAIEAELALSLADALFLNASDISARRPFVELGLDSINALEWIRVLNKQYGIALNATRIYEHPNLQTLAPVIARDLERKAAQARRSEPAVVAPATAAQAVIEPDRAARDAIAIVGISGRYPGADDLPQYWDNLASGRNSVAEIPASRWPVHDYFDPRPGQPGKVYCKWLGHLDGVEQFDSLFFDIAPSDAEQMDPQQRLFLEESYRAFEDAGYPPDRIKGERCGVYLGIMGSEYRARLADDAGSSGSTTGNSAAIAAARIAYHLDLKGPAIALNTACSSSLVATHLACQALHGAEIDMALVGGVSLYLAPETYVGMCQAGMLSPEGQCKAFDNSADGFVPAEGVGTLVLKRLGDAERDGDRIWGLIVGSGINQDGKTNGITAPNLRSQIDLEREVYDRHGIHPETISYVEAHGTGTKLGDPIELEALATVFKEKTSRRGYCALGSVKSNIGHTSCAAGVAGIHKVLLAMAHEELVPTLHFRTPNEHFDFEDSPFVVNTERRPWPAATGQPRRAAVSSFGFSGTNAHLVLEEYRADARPSSPGGGLRKPVVIALSGRTAEALQAQAQRLHDHLARNAALDLAAVARTLQVGRAAMEHRLAFVAADRSDTLAILDEVTRGSYRRVAIGVVRPDGRARAPGSGPHALPDVAQRWVRGEAVDWNGLYGDAPPRLISLPGYPFARERHWVEQRAVKPAVAAVTGHPLVQRNTSTLAEQRFTSVFTGDEPVLRDHVVAGRRVLSGAAQLEMARAAVAASADPELGMIQLSDVVWARPITMATAPSIEPRHSAALPIHIALSPGDAGEVRYEIYSAAEERDDSDDVLHSWGRAQIAAAVDPPRLSLDALRAGCVRTIDAAPCYATLQQLGLDYGPAHRAIERLRIGSDARGERYVLAELSLPASELATASAYGLHPSLLDGALQAAIGFSLDAGGQRVAGSPPRVPFGLDQLRMHAVSPARAVAYLRAGRGADQLDLDICDQTGRVCVQLTGIAMRAAEPTARLQPSQSAPGPAMRGGDHDHAELRDKTRHYLKQQVAKVVKLPVDHIEPDGAFERYGVDSILALRLVTALEPALGALPRTLFFEYQTLEALTAYCVASHAERLIALLGLGAAVAAPEPRIASHEHSPRTRRSRAGRTPRSSAPANTEAPRAADIAIVGISGRYPQASTLDQLWDNLAAGRDCITEIPLERWDHRLHFDARRNTPGKTYSKWGGFIDGVDEFDPLFFQISPHEAQLIDPQVRLFLQCVYATIEDAGYARDAVAGGRRGDGREASVGVFVGVMYDEYQLYGAQAQATGQPFALAGNSASIANRVSYFCNFTGPSIAVDTMCSSSLTSIHLACQSLALGDCDVAIAGGVNVSVHPNKYLALAQGNFVSSTGRCEAFGDGGDGYVPGEGVGAVLLKPLTRAIADGDHVYGVIKATAVNHGGKTTGYTVPNPAAQARVVARALQAAGVEPRAISYVEAHGTGTSLGDPIEIAGLTRAWEPHTTDRQFCAIGSVKSNIGHCEGAAGIAGLTKVLLQMQHGQLVPSLHAGTLNAHIDFARTPFFVQRELAAWPRRIATVDGVDVEQPRLAGLSSFGAGGANAHVIIEEYIAPVTRSAVPERAIIVLSAKTAEQLGERIAQLRGFLGRAQLADAALARIAYTLQVGREAMDHRLALTVGSLAELRDKLDGIARGEPVLGEVYRGVVKPGDDVLQLFAAEDELQALVARWLERGKHAKLLELWVRGLAIEWARLYDHARPQRIALPTYPFARDRHWIAIEGTPRAAAAPSATGGGSPESLRVDRAALNRTLDDWLDGKFDDSAAAARARQLLSVEQ